MSFQNIQASCGFEVIHDNSALACPNCEALTPGMKIDNREPDKIVGLYRRVIYSVILRLYNKGNYLGDRI